MQVPNEVKEEYRIKQKKAKDALQARRNEVFLKAPKIAELENQKLSLAYDLGGIGQIGANKTDFEALKSRVEATICELERQQKKLLILEGYPEDYLQIRYCCNECKDTGYLNPSKTVQCNCLKKKIALQKFATSEMDNGERFSSFNLALFKDEKHRADMKEVYDFALYYANNIPKVPAPNILIMGSAGLGKTFTLNCIGNRAIERGLNVIKITAYNLINEVSERIFSRDKEKAVPDYFFCDLLIIDDLGSESLIPNITVETLFSIINERGFKLLPTCFATNLKKQQLMDRYGDRIFSRLFSQKYTRIKELSGKDVRQK